MSTTKEPPEPFPGPPELPPEPFLLERRPPSPTLVGLPAPPVPPGAPATVAPLRLPLPPARAAAAASARPLRPRLVLAREAPELEQLFEGLRVELVYFRAWWPEHGPGVLRCRRRQALALALGIGLGLLLGAAALSWPTYARLLVRLAHVGAPPAASTAR